jgi:hypothetical protein
MFVTKIGADKQAIWSKIFSDKREVKFIVPLGNGVINVFNNNQSIFGNSEASIIEMEDNGNFISEYFNGIEDNAETYTDIATLKSGLSIILGTSSNSNSGDSFNFFATMDNETGNFPDGREYEYENGEVFDNLIPDMVDGGFYSVGGSFFGEFTLARYDTLLNILWVKKYVWPSNDVWVTDGIMMPDGSLFLHGTGNFTDPNGFALDFFGCKMDTAGNVLSNFYLASDANIGALEVIPIGGDTVVIAAVSDSQYFPVVDNDNLNLVVTVNSGSVISSFAFGSESREFPADVERINNQLVWGGSSNQYSTNDSSLAYLAISPLIGEGACTKIYNITAGDAINLMPDVTERTYSTRDFILFDANEAGRIKLE